MYHEFDLSAALGSFGMYSWSQDCLGGGAEKCCSAWQQYGISVAWTESTVRLIGERANTVHGLTTLEISRPQFVRFVASEARLSAGRIEGQLICYLLVKAYS